MYGQKSSINLTENSSLDTDLTLHDSQTPLTVRAIALSLTKQNNELIECRLTFQVNPQLYQRIDTDALFNLKPDARNPLSSGEFLPELDITIETSLKPDLLQLLAEHAVKINEAAKYILELSQEQPDNQILSLFYDSVQSIIGKSPKTLIQLVIVPRTATPTITFVDHYCAAYKDLFPEVRTFDNFKYLHVGIISDIKRKSLPAIARAVGLHDAQPLQNFLTDSTKVSSGIESKALRRGQKDVTRTVIQANN